MNRYTSKSKDTTRVNHTIYMIENMTKQLKGIATKKHISFNALINQILVKYLETEAQATNN